MNDVAIECGWVVERERVGGWVKREGVGGEVESGWLKREGVFVFEEK